MGFLIIMTSESKQKQILRYFEKGVMNLFQNIFATNFTLPNFCTYRAFFRYIFLHILSFFHLTFFNLFFLFLLFSFLFCFLFPNYYVFFQLVDNKEEKCLPQQQCTQTVSDLFNHVISTVDQQRLHHCISFLLLEYNDSFHLPPQEAS